MNKNQQMSDEECKEVFEYYGKQKDKKSQEQLAAMLSEIQEICGFISPEMAEKATQENTRSLEISMRRKIKWEKSL